MLVIAQKSGMAFALDPQHDGEVMWEYRAGQGGVLGGLEWGAAVDGEHAYFAVSDITAAEARRSPRRPRCPPDSGPGSRRRRHPHAAPAAGAMPRSPRP